MGTWWKDPTFDNSMEKKGSPAKNDSVRKVPPAPKMSGGKKGC